MPSQNAMASCCHIAACQEAASYCNQCGQPLLRCSAWKQCGGLLCDDGQCNICFHPSLTLEAGSMKSANVGGALALPLQLTNRSPVGRHLFLQGVWVREGTGAWSQCQVAWDKLPAGESKPISIIAQAMDRPGLHRLEIVIALSSRWDWQQETLAFSANIDVMVEDKQSINIHSQIENNAQAEQTGVTIAPMIRVISDQGHNNDSITKDTRNLTLTRASVYEREFGLRGAEDGTLVKRDTTFSWQGFQQDLTPSDGPIVSPDNVLTFGRSRSRAQAGPCDVRLLVFQPDGLVDREWSQAISRDHFKLWIECGRLMLRVMTDTGLNINQVAHARGESVGVSDGCTIDALPSQPGAAVIKIRFDSQHGEVVSIRVQRV